MQKALMDLLVSFRPRSGQQMENCFDTFLFFFQSDSCDSYLHHSSITVQLGLNERLIIIYNPNKIYLLMSEDGVPELQLKRENEEKAGRHLDDCSARPVTFNSTRLEFSSWNDE